jgi:hypothetical protein
MDASVARVDLAIRYATLSLCTCGYLEGDSIWTNHTRGSCLWEEEEEEDV